MMLLSTVKKKFAKKKLISICYNFFRGLLIMGISYVIIFPILSQLSISFMTRTDIWYKTVSFIPKHASFNNYIIAFENMMYPRALFNSFFFTLLVSVLQLVFCTFIAYGFARFKFWGNKFWFSLVIFSLIIPPEMIMTPLYLNFRFFNLWGLLPGEGVDLLNSPWPFIFTSITGTGVKNGLFIYIMRQFFKGMPRSLQEAAYVDGAGPFRTFFSIMLPGAISGLVVVFLFAFVWQWNEYEMLSMFMSTAETLLPFTLSQLASRTIHHSVNINAVQEEIALLNAAGSILFITPLILLYAFLQKYFVESIERTGIVG